MRKTVWVRIIQQLLELASSPLLNRGVVTKKRALIVPNAKTFCDVLRRFVPGTYQLVNTLLPFTGSSLPYSGDKIMLLAMTTAVLLARSAALYISLSSGELFCYHFFNQFPLFESPHSFGHHHHVITACVTCRLSVAVIAEIVLSKNSWQHLPKQNLQVFSCIFKKMKIYI